MDASPDSGFHKFNDGKDNDEPLRIKNNKLREEMGMTAKSEAFAKPKEDQGPSSKQKSMSEKEPTNRSKELSMSDEKPVRDRQAQKQLPEKKQVQVIQKVMTPSITSSS